MWDVIYYLLIVVFLAAVVIAAAFIVRAYLSGSTPAQAASAMVANMFGPKPAPRLDVVEQSNIDGRRRLILIRRDDVEHLIMTGGPVDMVIETGIQHQPVARARYAEDMSDAPYLPGTRAKASFGNEP